MKSIIIFFFITLFLTSFNYNNTLINKKWKLERGNSIITFHNNNTYSIDIINEENNKIIPLISNINWITKDNYIILFFKDKDDVFTVKYKIIFIDDTKLTLLDINEIESTFNLIK